MFKGKVQDKSQYRESTETIQAFYPKKELQVEGNYLYQHSFLLFGHLIGGLYPSGGGTKHSSLSVIGGQWRSM